MNANEYGIQFVLYTGVNMASFSQLGLTFTRPDNTTIQVNNPAVAINAATLVTPIGTFAGNTYLTYTFVNGDINQSGDYKVRGTYTDTSPLHLISNQADFIVGP